MLMTTTVYAVGVPLILSLIFIEAMTSARKSLGFYELGDTGGTIGLLFGNILTSVAIQGTTLGFSFYLYHFRLFTLNEVLAPWQVWVITFVAIDFIFYWYHRASHRVRILWAVHMNHHSSIEMNFTVAFRQAWFGPISKAPFFMVMPLVGFDPSMTLVAAICSRLWGVVGHTQWIGKLGWLDRIFNTPSTHRVHHGTNLEYIDRNYGNLFIFWDRLFGTYTKEQAPVIFGLVKNLNTNNPFIITFHTWAAMASDIQQAQSFYEIVGYIFGPPGWLPRRKMTAINKL